MKAPIWDSSMDKALDKYMHDLSGLGVKTDDTLRETIKRISIKVRRRCIKRYELEHYVQTQNPKSHHWVVIDQRQGAIVKTSRTNKPYKNIRHAKYHKMVELPKAPEPPIIESAITPVELPKSEV